MAAVLAIILGLYAGGSMIAVHLLFSRVYFGRDGEQTAPLQRDGAAPWSFVSGRNKLQGYLYGTENARALIVMAHGLGSNAAAFDAEARWFVRRGYRVFVYDAAGTAASEGRGTRGMAQSRLDLDAALGALEKDPAFAGLPVLLYGHSWGGYAAAAILSSDHPVRASVSIAGYNTPLGILGEQARHILGPPALLEMPFIALEHFFRFGPGGNVPAVKAINRSGAAVLVVHGTADKTVRYDGASIIARRKDITNPRTEYLVRDREGQNGHNDLTMAGEVLDEAFMNAVNAFYEKALQP